MNNISESNIDGEKVIYTDKGNGCGGHALVEGSEVMDMDFDEIVPIDEVDADDRELLQEACEIFNSKLDDFTHVAYNRSEDGSNPYVGMYLVW